MATNSGSAYPFEFDGTNWVPGTKILPADVAAGDHFGRYRISLEGNTAVIGSYWDDDAGSQSGSAYVFRSTTSGWQQVQKIAGSEGDGNTFGTTLAADEQFLMIAAPQKWPRRRLCIPVRRRTRRVGSIEQACWA